MTLVDHQPQYQMNRYLDILPPDNETLNISHLPLIAVIQYLATLKNLFCLGVRITPTLSLDIRKNNGLTSRFRITRPY